MYAQIAWLTKEVARLWGAVNSKGSGSGSGSGSTYKVTVQATEPEGNLTGNIGDTCWVVSGGVVVVQRVKTTASGNTGWV